MCQRFKIATEMCKMGISLEQSRVRIGCFNMPVKCRNKLKTLRLKYASLSIRVVLFFLLLAEGFEVIMVVLGEDVVRVLKGSFAQRSNVSVPSDTDLTSQISDVNLGETSDETNTTSLLLKIRRDVK